ANERHCCDAATRGDCPMKAKPRWMKQVIKTAAGDKTPLPFHRAVKADGRDAPLKKAANA
ncbi:MAG: hypothetical protein AAF762_11065, partial [Pseudomonadota bacterium]